MKTRELIAALQKEDPSGELEAVAAGTPIYFASREPAYYDGPLEMLIHDEAKRGRCYSIIGYRVTYRGEKVKLHTMGLDDVLLDDPDASVDVSECSEYSRPQWEKRVAMVRAEMREIKCETKRWVDSPVMKRAESEAAK